MKNLKKVLALVLVVVMALGLITVSNAAFTDAASIEKTEAVEVLSAIGVIGGYPDGSFKPEGDVTRAEMAKMVATIMNKGEDVGDLYKNACKFADSANHWAAGYIAYCTQEGIISGKSETKFDPEGKVTGTEAAKMLLCALGYNADAEGYKGATWASAVLSRAAKVGLVGEDANLTVDMGAPLNRENAAQILLNALQATMVKATKAGTNITLGDGTVINTGYAEPEDEYDTSANGAARIKGGEEGATSFTVELGEKMFKELEKNSDGKDAFGRKISKWTFESQPICDAYNAATLTFKDIVKGGELYTALGKITAGDGYTFQYFNDSKEPVEKVAKGDKAATGSELAKIASGNTADFGQIGDVIEVYKDVDLKTIDIIRINYHAAKIAQVWAAKVDANGDETQSAYVSLKAIDSENPFKRGTETVANFSAYGDMTNGSATQPNTVETAAFTAADKDAIVIYTAGGDSRIESVVKAESVTGLFSSYVNGESITIGGTKYASSKTFDAKTTLNIDSTAYLDPNGNIIYMESVASNDFAYLLKGGKTGGADETYESVLVFTDGTRKTVQLATKSQSLYNTKGVYAYKVDTNGKYELTAVPAYTNTVDGYQTSAGKATGNKYDTNTVKIGTGDNAINANANTVFVVETYDAAANAAVYTTYTGIANVPNIKTTGYAGFTSSAGSYDDASKVTGNSFVALTKHNVNSGYASIVYVFGATVESTSKNVTALYLAADKSVANDGNGNYSTVKAIVDGAETTIKVAEGAVLTGGDGKLLITDSMTVDTNGYVTGANAVTNLKPETDFAKDSDKLYTGTYANGVITFVNGDAYSVAETLPVYAYNVSTKTFSITTIGAYVPADAIGSIQLVLDTNDANVVTAIYIVEGSAGAFGV